MSNSNTFMLHGLSMLLRLCNTANTCILWSSKYQLLVCCPARPSLEVTAVANESFSHPVNKYAHDAAECPNSPLDGTSGD